MAIFNNRYYLIGQGRFIDNQGYEEMLSKEIENCATESGIERVLREELVEVTKHITGGIQDLVNYQENFKTHVNSGVLPLATWLDYINTIPEESIESLKEKLGEMKQQLEHAQLQGLPEAMERYGKPSFADLAIFYDMIFKKLVVLGKFRK